MRTGLVVLIFGISVIAGLYRVQSSTHAPRFTVEELVLGNPALLAEVRQQIAAHGTSQHPIRTTVAWDAVRLPIATRVERIPATSGNAQDRNGAKFLIARAATFPVDGKPRTAVFILQRPMSPTSTWPNESDITNAQLVHAALYPAAVNIAEAMHKHRSLNPQRVFDTLFAVQSYVMNQMGYLSFLKGVEFSKGAQAAAMADRMTHLFYQRFAPAFRYLEEQRDDIAQAPFAQAMLREAKRHLQFTEAEYARITELIAQSTQAMQQALAEFRWDGHPMTRGEFYDRLASTAEEDTQRAVVEAYSAAVLKGHRQGLFQNIDPLNAIARKYGFANYAAYASEALYQLSPQDFVNTMETFAANHDAKIARYVKSLTATPTASNPPRPHAAEKSRRLEPSQPSTFFCDVAEWEVGYRGMRGMVGPTLRFIDALGAAKAFYRDLGFDLDAAPFAGNIIFDTQKREDKYGNAFAARLGDGSQSWFHANFAPDQPITIDNLRTIVHELLHNIHGIVGTAHSQGNVSMGMAAQPTTWREGVARALESLIVTRAWMDRYLAHLPQFADATVRTRLATIFEDREAYDQMLVFARARFEMQLYDDRQPLQERLDAWSEIAERYLHVCTMPGHRGGMIWATPHFATAPGYYVSYTGGYLTARRAIQPIADGLARRDTAQMRAGGERLAELFRRGAEIGTPAQVEAAVNEIQSEGAAH